MKRLKKFSTFDELKTDQVKRSSKKETERRHKEIKQFIDEALSLHRKKY